MPRKITEERGLHFRFAGGGTRVSVLVLVLVLNKNICPGRDLPLNQCASCRDNMCVCVLVVMQKRRRGRSRQVLCLQKGCACCLDGRCEMRVQGTWKADWNDRICTRIGWRSNRSSLLPRSPVRVKGFPFGKAARDECQIYSSLMEKNRTRGRNSLGVPFDVKVALNQEQGRISQDMPCHIH